MRPSCYCVGAAIITRPPLLVCAGCGSPILEGAPERYTTVREAEWPPGCRSRRQARERIRARGGSMVGRGKAAHWEIDASVYHAPTPAKPVVVERAVLPGLRSDADVLADARREAEAIAPTRATRRAS